MLSPSARAVLARSEFDDRLAAITEAHADPDLFDGVYAVDVRRTVILTLAGGGPSAWIEFDPERETGTFHTTAPDYAADGSPTVIAMPSEVIALLEPYVELVS